MALTAAALNSLFAESIPPSMSRAIPVMLSARAPALPCLQGRHALRGTVLAGLLLALAACQPEGGSGGAASAGSAAKAAAAISSRPTLVRPSADSAVWQDLERLEREGRSHPAATEQALQELQGRTPAGSLARVQWLTLRGYLSTEMRDAALTERIVKDLEAWPEESTQRAAGLARLYILARQQRRQNDLRQAAKTLATLPSYGLLDAYPELLLRCQDFLTLVQLDLGEVDAAIAGAHEAVKLAEGTGRGWRRAQSLSILAFSYYQAQQPELALKAIEDSLREAQRDPSPALLYDIYTTRGIVQLGLGQVAIAEQAKQASLDAARQAGSDTLTSLALGNFADFHLTQGHYAEAKKFAEEALALAISIQNVDYELLARHNLGIAKIGLRRVEEGKREVLAALLRDEQRGSETTAAMAWNELGTHLERAGDLKDAAHAYHQYRRLIDKVLREETRKAMLEAQERYEDERRAKEIELLNRDNSLKSEQLRARDLQLRLWALLGGCVVLSAVLLGLAYQRIRRTNKALAHSNAALKIASERDPLTGLANRRHFQTAVKRLADKGKLSGTVFLIDIDHFKRINDSHGHAAGDTVLIEIANRLRASLRDEDLVVRWGGEEFLILIETREVAYASALAQRLLNQIAAPAIGHGQQTIAVTASIGYASFPVAPHQVALSWERAIDLVDTAMYMAKAHGRNKAYGIESMEARDEAGLMALASDLDAAWRAGLVRLLNQQGPAAGEGSRP